MSKGTNKQQINNTLPKMDMSTEEGQKNLSIYKKIADFTSALQFSSHVHKVWKDAVLDRAFPESCGYLVNPSQASILSAYYPTVHGIHEIPDEEILQAIVPVQQIDNFLTINDIPIWDRLDGEPIQQYKVFQMYRDMKYQASLDKRMLKSTRTLSRSLLQLNNTTGTPVPELRVMFHMYHWEVRVNAYDVYKQHLLEIEKEQMQDKLIDEHMLAAQDIMAAALCALEKASKDNAISVKEVKGLLDTAFKYGRISAGLPGDKTVEEAISSRAAKETNNNSNNTKKVNNSLVINYGPQGPINLYGGASQAALTSSDDNFIEGQVIESEVKTPPVTDENLKSVLYVLQQSNALGTAFVAESDEAEDEQVLDKGDSLEDILPKNRRGEVIRPEDLE